MAGIELKGTGGIIEGNLGAANVNVNLDSSLQFDGSDDKIDVGDVTVLDGDGSITVAAWVNFDSDSSDDQRFVWKTDAFGLGYFSGQLRGYIYYSGGDSNAQASHTVKGEGWKHVAMTYDGTTLRLYINGNEAATTSISSKTISNTSNNLRLGGTGTSSEHLKGKLADVRLYSSTLTDAEIKTLASKINIANESVQSTSTLVGWWKLNNNSITDSSTNSNNGTATGTTQVYDAFSVNVQDNSTTTDGNFTVTQGKVEGLALSCLTLDGTGDNVGCGTSSNIISDFDGGDFTVSAWFNPDSTTKMCIFSCGDDDNDHLQVLSKDNDIFYSHEIDGTLVREQFATGALVTTDKWHHITVTKTGSTFKFYLNGVQLTGATSQSSTAGQHGGNFEIGDNFNDDFFDGTIRDVRVYDGVTLSEEQVASLYSNTFVVTPTHMWKMDEGTGQNPNDTGTGTTRNGTGTGNADLISGNGPLDLDGTLTVDATGFLSAPRGDLELAATTSFAQSSASDTNDTFIHNNGRVVLTNSGTVTYNFSSDNAGSDNPLYDLQNQASGQVRFGNGFIIENSHSRSGGNNYNYLTGGRQYNYGTTSSPAAITAQLRVALSGGDNIAHIYGVSSLHPVTMDNWDDLPMTYDVSLKNINVTTDVTTNVIPSGRKVILDGDCEFDAFTVEAGGTLDLNGQRAEASGNLRIESGGAMKSTGGGLIVGAADVKILGSAEGMHDGDVNMIVSGGTHDWRNGAADGAAPWCRTVLVNGNVTHQDQLGPSSGSSIYNPESVIVGNGKLTQSGGHAYLKDLTIATGGDLEMTHGSSKTIDLYGDFTTSGGLLGASCLKFDGSNDTVTIPISASQNDHIKGAFADGIFTVEGWIKMESDFAGGNWVMKNQEFAVDIARDSATQWALADGGSWNFGANPFTMPNLEDGKWHHLAFCRRYTGSQAYYDIYVDGKLETVHTMPADSATWTANDDDLYIGSYNGSSSFLGEGADDTFVENIRIWGTTRTAAQIRADMFNSTPTSSASDCIANFTFNEGTGTAITASDPNNASSNETAGTWNGSWAGAGTFTYSTSTLVMAKAGTQTISCLHSEDIYNLTINDGSTTQLFTPNLTSGILDIFGNLTVHGIFNNHSSSSSGRTRMKAAKKIYVPQALEFNGSNQYINLGNELDYEDNITVSGWMRRHNDVPTEIVMFHNGGGEVDASLIQTRSTSGIRAAHNYQGTYYLIDYTTGSPIKAHEWNHVAIVFDKDGSSNADKFKLYINGTSVGSVTTGSAGRDADSARIGTYAYNLEKYWNGELADIRVYNASLSASEITTLATQIVPNQARTANLVGHWKLDETSGTTATDSGTGGNNGTHVNTPTHVGNRTTALANMAQMVFDFNGNIHIPELTTPKLILETNSNSGIIATGDLTINAEIEVNATTSFTGNGNTIDVDILDVNGGTLDMRDSDFTIQSGGAVAWHDTSSTILSGNTTLTGYSKANKADTYVPSAGNYEIVGNVKWLKLDAGATDDYDLTVIGSVIDCEIPQDAVKANIRQFHHALDTQQLLDADEEGDDDVKLPKPSLDNAHELQLGG